MKKWVLGLAVLILLGYGAEQLKSKVVGETPPDVEVRVQAAAPSAKQVEIQVTKDQVFQGNLLLVNKKHPVPEEGDAVDAVRLIERREWIQGFALLDNSIRLSSDLAEKFATMIDAAARDGVSRFMINSGYRDAKEQGRLYREMGADYAMPAGYSEHNLGLSLDIGSTQGEMNQSEEGRWLEKNAWRYGFILRYPKDKTDITGIQYEPWHFRYVGLPHSAIMQEKDMVLEQYLEFLKEEGTVSAAVEGKTYEISYRPVAKTAVVHVPADRRYDISGDNMGGVIVTVYP